MFVSDYSFRETLLTALPSLNKHIAITFSVTAKSRCRIKKIILTFPHLYFTFSSWSMFACKLANQAKNCNTNWHRFKTKHLIVVQYVWLATVSCCSLLAITSHLLCCFYPVILHIKHLETLEQDVLCWSGYSRRKGGLQGPGRKAAQILNGQLQSKPGLSVSTHTHKPLYEASWTARRAASASPLISIQANIPCCFTLIKMFTLQRSELNSYRCNYIVLLTSLTFGK